jgi:methionyl-tRNA formyltransferase
MRVVFWGTPEFAAASLRALIGEGFDVVAVVTQPDKPQGRSRTRVVAPPVKEVAAAEELPVLQPDSPRDPAFVEALRALQPDISIVVAYGHILSRDVIRLPRLGTLNVHASLLPALRGAAPIQAAIREGREETGVTIMRMVEQLDAGPIIRQRPVPILPDMTYGELALELAEHGAQALIEALALLEAGAVVEQPQNEALATYAPRITRESARIDWTATAVDVSRAIRAYDPKPGAWTTLRGVEVRVFGARLAPSGAAAPGEVVEISKSGMTVATGAGNVQIIDLHPAGKRRMTAAEMQAGRLVAVGDRLH